MAGAVLPRVGQREPAAENSQRSRKGRSLCTLYPAPLFRLKASRGALSCFQAGRERGMVAAAERARWTGRMSQLVLAGFPRDGPGEAAERLRGPLDAPKPAAGRKPSPERILGRVSPSRASSQLPRTGTGEQGRRPPPTPAFLLRLKAVESALSRFQASVEHEQRGHRREARTSPAAAPYRTTRKYRITSAPSTMRYQPKGWKS